MDQPEQITIHLSARFAWWVRPYLACLLGFSALTGLEPDADKAADLISRRGLRFVAG